MGDVTAYGYNSSGLETSVTDPDHNTTTYAYDADRRLTSTSDALHEVTGYAFDADGNPLTTTDALGRVTTTNYDVMGRLTKTTDALGGLSSATYDAAGLALQSTDALGHVGSSVYDPYHRGLTTSSLAAVNTPVQAANLSSYDNAGQTTGVRDADGNWDFSSFDGMGRVTQTTDALGATTRSVYDLDGELIASRDAVGRWTYYNYNARGRQTTMTDAQGNVTTTAYDAAGDATLVTDPLGHTTATAYDALDRATAVTDALNHTTTTTFDAAGNVATVKDANSSVTSYAYDALNRATMTTVAVGTSAQASSTVAYDAVGNVTSATDALGQVTGYQYDALNRQTATTDALSHTTTTAYDLLGDVTAVTDALNQTTSYLYDQLDQLIQTTDALGNATTSVVDVAGEGRASIDPLGDVTQTLFDGDQRDVGSVDAKREVTRTALNAAGETASVTDAVGNQTRYIYDSLGRQTVTIDPLGNRTTTTYDSASRVSTVTDADGREQVFHYDAADRLTAATWLAYGGATVNLQTFTYDNDNNQLTAADYSGTYTNGYDAQDRLTSQTDPLGLTLTYQYDTGGRVTQRADSLGGVLTYVYDTANRLTSEQFGGAGQTQARVDLGYDNRDELTSLTRYTDVAGSNLVGTTVYAYDASQRLTAITDKTGGAATLSYYDYMLDNAGRVTQESWQSENTTGGTIGGTHTYSYDATSQLTAADGTVYNYDPNGNQTGGSYQTGSANRLTNDGTWTYTYDNVGDLIEKSKGSGLETWYYGYDTLNRLTSVEQTTDGTTAELTATYSYDVYNHRIEEDDWQTGGAVTVTKTAYDGDNAWVDTNGSGVVQTRYLWGPGVDQLLGRSDASGDEWLLTDRLGSVRDVVGSAGTLVLDHAEYQAFGGVASDTAAAAAGKYGSEGEREDRTTGLVQSGGVRVDDTQTHQWMQEDPTGFDAGDANLRRVVGNDPTNATDPSGLSSVKQVPRSNSFSRFSVELYFEPNGWFGGETYIGMMDPNSFAVVRNGLSSDLTEVTKEAANDTWTPDWDKWFRDNGHAGGTDPNWYMLNKISSGSSANIAMQDAAVPGERENRVAAVPVMKAMAVGAVAIPEAAANPAGLSSKMAQAAVRGIPTGVAIGVSIGLGIKAGTEQQGNKLWYHGTDNVSGANIVTNGLNLADFLAAKPDDPRGVFVSPNSGDAGDYARLRTFDRNKVRPAGTPKLTAVILVADDADIKSYLEDVPGGHAGEKYIPVAKFSLVPRTAFKPSGIDPNAP